MENKNKSKSDSDRGAGSTPLPGGAPPGDTPRPVPLIQWQRPLRPILIYYFGLPCAVIYACLEGAYNRFYKKLDKDGYFYYAISEIKKDTFLGQRTIVRCKNILEKYKLIVTDKKKGIVDRYKIYLTSATKTLPVVPTVHQSSAKSCKKYKKVVPERRSYCSKGIKNYTEEGTVEVSTDTETGEKNTRNATVVAPAVAGVVIALKSKDTSIDENVFKTDDPGRVSNCETKGEKQMDIEPQQEIRGKVVDNNFTKVSYASGKIMSVEKDPKKIKEMKNIKSKHNQWEYKAEECWDWNDFYFYFCYKYLNCKEEKYQGNIGADSIKLSTLDNWPCPKKLVQS
jgi:hypothetical protein